MIEQKMRNRVLTEIWPRHSAAEPEKWQQRKSDSMRARLIEAAIDCLVEKGYSGLSTVEVAERCAVSRGAMHHHFPTRMDMVMALTERIFYLRMHIFLDNYFAAVSSDDPDASIVLGTQLHWQSVKTREYSAYLHLLIAARTDGELEQCFIPAAKRFDDIWNREMTQAFPLWEKQKGALQLVSDFALTAHMGLMLNEPVLSDSKRVEAICNAIISTVLGVRQDAPQTDSIEP